MKKKLKEIAEIINGKLYGDEDVIIVSVNELDKAQEGEITFLRDKRYVELLKNTKASCVIIPEDLVGIPIPTSYIVVKEPYLAFIKILEIIYSEKSKNFYKGIHPSVLKGESVKLENNVSIGPYCVLGDKVEIGENSILVANVFVGNNVKIGKNVLIYPNVTILEDTVIGNNVIIQSGTVIGSDGFGYIQKDGKHVKVPQVGKVVIEDDVEIGANVTIDRATISETRISKGTKIDNLVHIAHNVLVGENVLLLAQVGIAGSSKVGDNTVLAGQTGVTDHILIGKNVKAGPRTGIVQNVDDNQVVWGTPPIPFEEQKRISVASRRLPKLLIEFNKLKSKVEQLEKAIAKIFEK